MSGNPATGWSRGRSDLTTLIHPPRLVHRLAAIPPGSDRDRHDPTGWVGTDGICLGQRGADHQQLADVLGRQQADRPAVLDHFEAALPLVAEADQGAAGVRLDGPEGEPGPPGDLVVGQAVIDGQEEDAALVRAEAAPASAFAQSKAIAAQPEARPVARVARRAATSRRSMSRRAG